MQKNPGQDYPFFKTTPIYVNEFLKMDQPFKKKNSNPPKTTLMKINKEFETDNESEVCSVSSKEFQIPSRSKRNSIVSNIMSIYGKIRDSNRSISHNLTENSFEGVVKDIEIGTFVKYFEKKKKYSRKFFFLEFKNKDKEIKYLNNVNVLDGFPNEKKWKFFPFAKLGVFIGLVFFGSFFPFEIFHDFSIVGLGYYIAYLVLTNLILPILLFYILLLFLCPNLLKNFFIFEISEILVFLAIYVVSIFKISVFFKNTTYFHFEDLIFCFNLLLLIRSRIRITVLISFISFLIYSCVTFGFNHNIYTSSFGKQFIKPPEGTCDYPVCIDLHKKQFEIPMSLVGFILIQFTLIFYNYMNEFSRRNLFFQKKQLESIEKRIDRKLEEQDILLRNILPSSIFDSLKHQFYTRFVTNYKTITTIVCKIDQFYSKIWREKTPNEIVEILTTNFSVLSLFLQSSLFERLVTYDDFFIAVGGMDIHCEDEEEMFDEIWRINADAIELGRRMISSVVPKNTGKVGISFGRFIFGIFGKLKLKMKCFGPSIEEAKKLCENSKKGEILVSKAIQDSIGGKYNFQKIIRNKSECYLCLDDTETEIISACPSIITPNMVDGASLNRTMSSTRGKTGKNILRKKSVFQIEDSSLFIHKKTTSSTRTGSEGSGSNFKFNSVSLRFDSVTARRMFSTELYSLTFHYHRILFFVQFLFMGFVTICCGLFFGFSSLSSLFQYILTFIQVILGVVIFFISLKFSKTVFSFYLTHLFSYLSLFLILFFGLLININSELVENFVILCAFWSVMSVFIYPLIPFFLKIIFGVVFFFIFITIPLIVHHQFVKVIGKSILVSVMTYVVCALNEYFSKKEKVKCFAKKNEIIERINVFCEEKKLNEKLLLTIFPEFVVNDVKDLKPLVKVITNGGILCLKMYGFDLENIYSSFQFLSELFGEIKRIESLYNDVHQVKCFENYYFLTSFKINLNIAYIAFDIREALLKLIQFENKGNVNWGFIIGLHSCDIVSAVIGAQKMTYDVLSKDLTVTKELCDEEDLTCEILFLQNTELHKTIVKQKEIKIEFQNTGKIIKDRNICKIVDICIPEE